MPPRLVTAAIVLFWLVMTGILIVREMTPRFRAGEAPPFTIELTDEVGGKNAGANSVNWIILQKGLDKAAGFGFSRVRRLADRNFELYTEFKLERFRVFGQDLPNSKITGAYVITEEGALKSSAAKVKFDIGPTAVEINFHGDVRDRQFHPKLEVLWNGKDVNPYPLEPFAVSESGKILNPMHLVHRISGLKAGQTWPIPLMDPLQAVPEAVRTLLPGKEKVVSQVFATVTTEDLDWHHERVPCFKISYARPDERPIAATWVRRRDAVVLQQWAGYEGVEYTLQRAAQQ